MNFLSNYKTQLARLICTVFLVQTLMVPLLSPLTMYAADQAEPEAVHAGINDGDNPPNFGCFGGSFDTKMIAGCAAAGGYYLMFKPAYIIAGWMSTFFNFALNEFVMGMGSLVNEMTGIMVAWKTIRDITNVFLVFLTVYIGIATILGISGYGAKQLLWKVVLAALLVNFSVTFTKVVIDISNLTSVQIYTMFEKAMGTSGCAQGVVATGKAGLGTAEASECITHGIAAAFWSQMRVTTIFNIDDLKAKGNTQSKDILWNLFYTFAMAAIMFLVMAFAFGGAAFLLVGRFVILIFLLIVSPLALVLWITGVSGQGRAWWQALIKQSIFPPAILLCWWIAFVILQTYAAQFAGVSLSEGAIVSGSGIAIVSLFIIVIGFLIAGLILASKLGAYGANAVLKTGKDWSKKGGYILGAGAGAVTVGAGAYAARQTVGRGAAKINDTEHLKNAAASTNFLKRQYGKIGLAASKKVAGSSFDARAVANTKALGSAGGKGGFNKWAEEKAKKTEELHKHISTYKGTNAERNELNNKLTNVEQKHAEIIDKAKEKHDTEGKVKIDEQHSKAAEAFRERELATTEEQRKAADAKAKEAHDEIQRLTKEHKDTLDELNAARIAEKNAVTQMTVDAYKKKGDARAAQNLDYLATESTLGVMPTPQWKRDVVTKIKKTGGASKEEQAIRTMIESLKEQQNAAPSENPETPPTA